MARIAVFAKYFGYNVGGAEHSVLELMNTLEAAGHHIVACVNVSPKHFGAKERRISLPPTWDVVEFELPVDLEHFRFVEYHLNKPYLEKLSQRLADCGVDKVYAYGNLAPAVINQFLGKTVYLARDEYGLGWNVNYYKGVRRFLQGLYHSSECALRFLWRRDLSFAVRKSELIANSRFIAKELAKMAGGSPVAIVYPKVNVETLCVDYQQAKQTLTAKPGVVAVADNILKGGDIVKQVATRMPDIDFYLFDRKYRAPLQLGNLHLMPWEKSGGVFAHAAMVMVPSRWAEAYGRVVFEAQSLGIPVVASARGGIPEVMQDASMLVHDIDNASEWESRIRLAMATER